MLISYHATGPRHGWCEFASRRVTPSPERDGAIAKPFEPLSLLAASRSIVGWSMSPSTTRSRPKKRGVVRTTPATRSSGVIGSSSRATPPTSSGCAAAYALIPATYPSTSAQVALSTSACALAATVCRTPSHAFRKSGPAPALPRLAATRPRDARKTSSRVSQSSSACAYATPNAASASVCPCTCATPKESRRILASYARRGRAT